MICHSRPDEGDDDDRSNHTDGLTTADLREAARQTQDANASRRMLAIALLLAATNTVPGTLAARA